MKEALGVLIAFGFLWGMTALAVERFDDRELFVSPPDAVAENFVRAVINERYEPARAFLENESSMTDEELRALHGSLGDPSEIEAKIVTRDDRRALVNVRVASGEMSNAVAFKLAFDREWKIQR